MQSCSSHFEAVLHQCLDKWILLHSAAMLHCNKLCIVLHETSVEQNVSLAKTN